MTKIVYGSTGFIGSSLLEYFKSAQIPSIGYSRRNLDMLDSQNIASSIRKVKNLESIIFCAGPVPVKDSESLAVNIQLFEKFLLGIEEFAPDLKITYISSDAVYSSNSFDINEMKSVEPDSLHGQMHLTREKMLNSAEIGESLILRPTAVFGVGDTHNSFGPNRFARELKNSKIITLHGAAHERRDHLWVKDLLSYIVQLEKSSVGVFNLASGVSVSFLEVVEKLGDLIGHPINIIQDEENHKMPYSRSFDVAKVVNETKIEFPNSLDTGLFDMVAKWDQV